MLAVFAEFERDILRERVKAGIAQAREQGRPVSAANKAAEVKKLYKQGLNKSEIARRVKIGRTSVVRILNR